MPTTETLHKNGQKHASTLSCYQTHIETLDTAIGFPLISHVARSTCTIVVVQIPVDISELTSPGAGTIIRRDRRGSVGSCILVNVAAFPPYHTHHTTQQQLYNPEHPIQHNHNLYSASGARLRSLLVRSVYSAEQRCCSAVAFVDVTVS